MFIFKGVGLIQLYLTYPPHNCLGLFHFWKNIGRTVCLTTYLTIGVQSPAEVKDFSSNLCVQTGSEAHPAS
jgi:hypothetical protein